MTSVPEITRMIARIEDWKGQGPVLGRAEAARRLEEAHKLLEEIADMLTHMRRELLGGRTGQREMKKAARRRSQGAASWCGTAFRNAPRHQLTARHDDQCTSPGGIDQAR